MLPSSLQNITGNAFEHCYSLESITIHKSNKYMVQINDVIYSYDRSVLMLVLKYKTGVFSVPSNVKSINSYCFTYSMLSSVTIPEGITIIPAYCFAYSNVNTVNLPSTIKILDYDAFDHCNLNSINIPEGTEEIGFWCFSYCSFNKQTKIVFPSSLKYLRKNCFYNCINITEFVLNEGLKIDYYAFSGCSISQLTLPSTIKFVIHPFGLFDTFNIDIETYNGKKYLLDNQQILYNEDKTIIIQETSNNFNNYIIPSYVKQINPYAFYNSEVTSITFEDNSKLSYVGEEAFTYCDSISEIHFNSDVGVSLSIDIRFGIYMNEILNIYIHQKKDCSLSFFVTDTGSSNYDGNIIIDQSDNCSLHINPHVFYSCDSQNLSIYQGSNSIITFEQDAFINAKYIKTIIISQGKGSTFNLSGYAFYNNSKLEKIDLGDYLDNLPNSCFENCTALETVKIPTSCLSIGNHAFKNCYSLKNIEYSDNSKLNIIGNNAFENCSFVNFFVPSSVISIGSYAFYNCTSLKIINIPKSVNEVGKDAFLNCKSLSSCLDIGTNSKSFITNLIEVAKLPSKCICVVFSTGDQNVHSLLKQILLRHVAYSIFM